MAGDWIKMRAALCTHPKVVRIAELISESTEIGRKLSTGFNGSLCELVTSDVTRDITLASLLRVWCATNEHTEDGVWHRSSLKTIDAAAGIPGFGEAMAEVGWALHDQAMQTVTLPDFLENNAPAKRGARSSAAERQAKYRAKKSAERDAHSDAARDVTRDVTSDAREEKRREELLPDESNDSSSSPAMPPTAKRGEVPCPYDEIIAVYHELLPMLPHVRIVTEKRKREMRKRWGWVLSSRKPNGERRATNADEALAWFRDYFGRCAADAFVNGEAPRGKGHEGWEADISFVMRDDCLVKIAEKTGRVAA